MSKYDKKYLVRVNGEWLYYVDVGRGGHYSIRTVPYTYDAADSKTAENAIAIAKNIGGIPFEFDPLISSLTEIPME